MDSPQPSNAAAAAAAAATAATAAAPSGSPPVQESPFSNYVSTLSPIKPLKAIHAGQGFIGLNSPPLVFTSPRIISHHERSYMQRPQSPQACSAEVPRDNDISNKIAHGPDDLEKSGTHLSSRLITDRQKYNDVKEYPQDQSGSPSGYVDEYLSDPVEEDCANSMSSINPEVKQSNHELQSSLSGLIDSKKAVLECHNENAMSTNIDASQALSEQAQENSRGQFESNLLKFEQRSDDVQPSNECSNVESFLPVEHDSKKQHCDDLASQTILANEDQGENAGPILGPVQDKPEHDPEASQLQRGMSRRCLLFEESQQKTIVNGTCSPNAPIDVTDSRSPASTAELEGLGSSQVDLTTSSSKKQMANFSQPTAATFPPHHSGKSPLVVSKPSGIGLHLNSIINSLPMGGSISARTKSVPTMSCNLVESKDRVSKLNSVAKVSVTAEDGMIATKAPLLTATSATSESLYTMEPSNMLQSLEHEVTPNKKRQFNSEQVDDFEYHQLSPNQKRKKSSSSDGDGCKRCNCKKSKCLKLYCDCFAAGIYCAEPCACLGCFNRPEYEDTVLETRQQIESRNPLAFAPKVVQPATEFPPINGEDINRFTPSSARHKRGCNCKKSMCLKKYCECYQASVGCSNECRCEGCKNTYGRKDAYFMTEERAISRAFEERWEGALDGKLEMVPASKDLLHDELHDLHNLTPLTPSLQCSDQGKNASRSRLISSKYLPSPESDFPLLPSFTKSTRSMANSYSTDMLPESSKDILDTGTYGQGINYKIDELMDQFSPRCDPPTSIREFPPLQNLSSLTKASSASSRTGDLANVSRLQFCPGSVHLSSGSSLRWRNSPITPMTRLGETKNQAVDSDGGLYDTLEDDIPEILKEASTPIASVKVSSPNKKRISPPRRHVHEFGSGSSGAFKSGRKFILKAVPSFPPLTPCTDPKGGTDQRSQQ